jgi:hypothetical protein
MAYDEALAQGLRDGLRGVKGVSEKRMMGGLCVLVNGNMLGGVDRTKAGADRFMSARITRRMRRPGATIVEMGGRRLGGLVFVDAEACDRDALKEWLAFALGFVGKLPRK